VLKHFVIITIYIYNCSKIRELEENMKNYEKIILIKGIIKKIKSVIENFIVLIGQF